VLDRISVAGDPSRTARRVQDFWQTGRVSGR
jgi:hypothetical protein